MLKALASHFTDAEVVIVAPVLILLVLAWFLPKLGDGVLARVEKAGARFAQRKNLAIAALAAATILIRLAVLHFLPVPVPHVHDEFSYLLAADTFVHGRLTNPPHPMWIFFDTFHVNQQPTYMSKYPPAMGAVLAVGQLLGNPWIGVLLSAAAMCAAVLWALQGWLPARWALLAGTLVMLRLGIFSYWTNSFWGGTAAAIGGALVIGALPRLLRRARSRDAVVLGIGVAILANSRPFEGLLFCLPVMVVLLAWLLRKSSPALRVTVPRLVVPFAAVMALTAIFMGYYNWRGTGSPLLSPYALNDKLYLSTPVFVWQKPKPLRSYANDQFNDFYNSGWVPNTFAANRLDRPWHALRDLVIVPLKFARFFLWPELCIPLLALPWLLRRRDAQFLTAQLAFCLLGSATVVWFFPHYAGDLTASLFALLALGLRGVRIFRPGGRAVGIALSRAVVLSVVILAPFHPPVPGTGPSDPCGIPQRAQIAAQLNSMPGEHLVIVRYAGDHDPGEEWVYNAADIDHAKVIWARQIAGVDINPLLNYFRGRRVWFLDADDSPQQLIPDMGSSPHPDADPESK